MAKQINAPWRAPNEVPMYLVRSLGSSSKTSEHRKEIYQEIRDTLTSAFNNHKSQNQERLPHSKSNEYDDADFP